MRAVTFTKEQFDTFVFKLFATVPSKDDTEIEVAIRVLRKLKDPALTEALPMNAAERAAEAQGDRAYSLHRLCESRATFLLEEDERKLLEQRLRDQRKNVPTFALEDLQETVDTIHNAPEHKAQVVG